MCACLKDYVNIQISENCWKLCDKHINHMCLTVTCQAYWWTYIWKYSKTLSKRNTIVHALLTTYSACIFTDFPEASFAFHILSTGGTNQQVWKFICELLQTYLRIKKTQPSPNISHFPIVFNLILLTISPKYNILIYKFTLLMPKKSVPNSHTVHQ